MSPNFIQEQLSWAFVQAVIFRAGYRLSVPWVDDHGIDGTVESYAGGINKVDFQLKATTDYEIRDGDIRYDLRVENYNQLVKDDGLPSVLILFTMPDDPSQWLGKSPEELCLRKCAYWVLVRLKGERPSGNVRTVRVSVPLNNVFDEDGLRDMFSWLFR